VNYNRLQAGCYRTLNEAVKEQEKDLVWLLLGMNNGQKLFNDPLRYSFNVLRFKFGSHLPFVFPFNKTHITSWYLLFNPDHAFSLDGKAQTLLLGGRPTRM